MQQRLASCETDSTADICLHLSPILEYQPPIVVTANGKSVSVKLWMRFFVLSHEYFINLENPMKILAFEM